MREAIVRPRLQVLHKGLEHGIRAQGLASGRVSESDFKPILRSEEGRQITLRGARIRGPKLKEALGRTPSGVLGRLRSRLLKRLVVGEIRWSRPSRPAALVGRRRRHRSGDPRRVAHKGV